MKTIYLTLALCSTIGVSIATASSHKDPSDPASTNDTSVSLIDVKANTFSLFKLIPSPSTNNNQGTNNTGSLKKASKVARTSYSHLATIETILYKKNGI